MACRNAAAALLDGAIPPYRAVGFIAGVGYWEPPLERDLLTAMRELRIRYEDEPAERPTLDVEITDRLGTWLQERSGVEAAGAEGGEEGGPPRGVER